ncbi:MAG TPA: hypothetical protein VG722_07985, partial [Tepidisphaeraceae bacterium]|nr:hypothetical protein [Tepidisphaeraceae bacterium]
MISGQGYKSASSEGVESSPWPFSPWLFVPILYVMQAMPVTVAQEMFPVTFKDLHIPNPLIVAWTSIIALPWTLKLFWAPMVDLNSTKRRWTLVMECLIGLSFIAVAASVLLPQYINGQEQVGFAVVLAVLLIM